MIAEDTTEEGTHIEGVDRKELVRVPSEARSATWPANRFYWAVLDAPGGGGMTGAARSGTLAPGLLAALQDELPVSVDSVHAVCVPVREAGAKSSSVVVCACSIDELAKLDASVLRLSPESVPEILSPLPAEIEASRINLLIGERTPRLVVQARARRHTLLALTTLVCMLALAIGLTLRAQRADERSRALIAARDAALKAASSNGQESAVLSRLDGLRQLDTVLKKTPLPFDAPATLAAVLASWPLEPKSSVQSMNITRDAVNLSVVVDADAGDAKTLLDKVRAPPGFELTEPRMSTAAGLTRLNILFRRQSTGEGAKP